MVSLKMIKRHLFIPEADTRHDAYLRALVPVAQEVIEGELNAPIVRNAEQDGVMISQGLRHAALLLVGHWFNHREAATSENLRHLPFGIRSLVGQYRRPACPD